MQKTRPCFTQEEKLTVRKWNGIKRICKYQNFKFYDIISDFCDNTCVWKALTWKQIIICRVHIMWHGGKSVSGCLPLPCSHHGGPNKGWGLGAWGSWRILGLLQTNSWDLWGRNSHCCVKIITKGWNDYLHKKRESNDVCTNQNFHSILIFVPNVWGVDSKYRNTAVVFTPFGRCLRVNWESSNTARKEKRKKPKEKTRLVLTLEDLNSGFWPFFCSDILDKRNPLY